jgi:hypothetical protein
MRYRRCNQQTGRQRTWTIGSSPVLLRPLSLFLRCLVGLVGGSGVRHRHQRHQPGNNHRSKSTAGPHKRGPFDKHVGGRSRQAADVPSRLKAVCALRRFPALYNVVDWAETSNVPGARHVEARGASINSGGDCPANRCCAGFPTGQPSWGFDATLL